jgi:transcriptional regulator with XRE-family HTH domain
MDLEPIRRVLAEATGPEGQFSRRGLSKAAGLGASGIADIMQGRSTSPTIGTLAKIAAAMGTDLSVFGLSPRPVQCAEPRKENEEARSEIAVPLLKTDPQPSWIMSTVELLQLLADRKIRRNAIAAALGIDPAGVTRLYDGNRQLTLDEARRLVDHFNLERVAVNPLSLPVARLMVLYAACALRVELPEEVQVDKLAEDLQKFLIFASDPKMGGSTEAASGFFRALQLSKGL